MKKIEVSTKEIVIYAFRHWYIIAILAIGLSVALYALGSDRRNAEHLRLMEVYNKQKAAYEQSTPVLDGLYTKKAEIENYLNYGNLVNVDPYDYSTASITLDVNTDADTPEMNRIANHYAEIFKSAPLLSVLSKVVPENQNEAYLREVVRLARIDNDLLVISAIGNDQIDPLAVVDTVAAYLISNKSVVEKSAGAHELTMMIREEGRGIDRSLVDVRTRHENALIAVNKQIDAARVTEPKMPAILDNSVRDIVAGFIGGAILGLLLVVAFYLIKMPIQFPDQLMRQFSIRYIGKIKFSNNKIVDSNDLHVTNENLREAAAGCESVLLLGDSYLKDSPFLKEYADSLKSGYANITYANDILNNADAVKKLQSTACTVLVCSLHSSRVRQVDKEFRRVALSDNKVIGYIVLTK